MAWREAAPAAGPPRPRCASFVSPHAGSRAAFWYLLLPSAAFLAFLGLRFQASLRKLQRSRSQVMGVYYAFAWVAALLAALRCLVQLLPAPGLWNALWLVTQSGMLLLEVSVLVFLVPGLAATTQQALVRTLGVAGAAAGVDAGVKALYIYALHVPLLLDGSTAADPFGDARWSKWSFWLVRAALPAAAYCYVAALPSTPHRALLPAKPELSRHAACLAAAHALQALGAALVGSRAGAGYCVFGAGAWLYDALFPPLVYCTFLLGFFGADELDTDLLLYSEMREAEFV